MRIKCYNIWRRIQYCTVFSPRTSFRGTWPLSHAEEGAWSPETYTVYGENKHLQILWDFIFEFKFEFELIAKSLCNFLCVLTGLVKRKVLVLDLDETLIHSHHDGVIRQMVKPGTPPDFVLKVTIDRHPVRFFVHKRPHVDFFLDIVSVSVTHFLGQTCCCVGLILWFPTLGPGIPWGGGGGMKQIKNWVQIILGFMCVFSYKQLHN